jgi:hypothetical protein
VGNVFAFPSCPASISQEELEVIKRIENQIRTLQRLHLERSAALLQRLLAGATIERGPRTADITDEWRLEIH